jgi:hypothetical protein
VKEHHRQREQYRVLFPVDLDNDGQARELLPQFGKGPLVWYEIAKGALPVNRSRRQNHGHGIGAGDERRQSTDVLTAKGWFSAGRSRARRTGPSTPPGTSPAARLSTSDINGDGRNDVLATASRTTTASGGWSRRRWQVHRQTVDESWSQVHATTLIDLNGDGRPDLFTGKRYMAHDKDPGAREPLGIYWYEFRKSADGKRVEWVRHIIDYSTRAGAGMQLPVADLDGDGDLDFVAPGKSGLFLFENLTKRK